MASNIVSDSINENYPVAGVDNDSQGFRDNFSTIKDNFAAAKSEIEDIQNKAIFKSALSSGELVNNMGGESIIDVELDQATEKFTGIGTVTDNQNISFINGSYQTVTVAGDMELTLADWPDSGRLARMTLEIINDEVTRNITVVGENNAVFKTRAADTFITNNSTDIQMTIESSEDPYIIDMWTYDAGATVYVEYKGQFA